MYAIQFHFHYISLPEFHLFLMKQHGMVVLPVALPSSTTVLDAAKPSTRTVCWRWLLLLVVVLLGIEMTAQLYSSYGVVLFATSKASTLWSNYRLGDVVKGYCAGTKVDGLQHSISIKNFGQTALLHNI